MKPPTYPHAITEDALKVLADYTEKELEALSRVVLEGRKPPAGAYAFFHHSGHALARLKDCRLILRRLYRERRLLTALAWRHRSVRLRGELVDQPSGRLLLRSEQQENETVAYMQVDLESLYLFGGTLLDQWAYQVIAVGGLSFTKEQREKPFIALLDHLESKKGQTSPLKPFWDECGKSMIWLHCHLRVYRNTFIVHANRPWQRGNTRGTYGEDFQLHTPSPPGWLDDAEIDAKILELGKRAGVSTAENDDEWRRPVLTLQNLMARIADLPKADREEVIRLYKARGGLTPTFQVIARHLFELIATGTNVLIRIAETDLARVELGPPKLTSEDMWKALREEES
jgi:hypothetical protein